MNVPACRLIKLLCSPRLLFETPHPILIRRKLSRQNFQRDFTIELSILRAIHFTHSTRAEFCAGGNVHLGGTSSQLALLRQSHPPQQVGVARVAAERLVGYIPSDSRQ